MYYCWGFLSIVLVLKYLKAHMPLKSTLKHHFETNIKIQFYSIWLFRTCHKVKFLTVFNPICYHTVYQLYLAGQLIGVAVFKHVRIWGRTSAELTVIKRSSVTGTKQELKWMACVIIYNCVGHICYLNCILITWKMQKYERNKNM